MTPDTRKLVETMVTAMNLDLKRQIKGHAIPGVPIANETDWTARADCGSIELDEIALAVIRAIEAAGWRIVDREPTDEMIYAVDDVIRRARWLDRQPTTHDKILALWDAIPLHGDDDE